MKKIKEYTHLHEKWFSITFSIVTVLLSFIGSYQYYTQYANVVPNRLWSAVFFSTIKMYGFSPTAGAGSATPICYEIAKWLAPACTLYWAFRLIESYLRHAAGLFAARFLPKKQLLVFGWNKESKQFIENVTGTKQYRILLFTEEELDKKVRYDLQRNHVLVIQEELFHDKVWKSMIQRKLRYTKISKVVFFYQDSVKNFTLYARFIKGIPKEQSMDIQCAIRCEDFAMREPITEYHAKHLDKKVTISLFSIAELAANEMFQEHKIYDLCLEKAKKKADTPTGLLENMPNPHVLIAGFGSFGKAVLDETLIRGTLSPCSRVKGYEKLRITIIDHEKEKCERYIRARYPRIDEICKWKCIDMDVENVELERKLMVLPEATYVAVCFSDQLLNIHTANKLQRYYRVNHKEGSNAIPFAIRVNLEDEVFDEKAEKDSPIRKFTFGKYDDILTLDNVFMPRTEKDAKEFHARYDEKSSRENRTEWNKLNFYYLESNRAQGKNKGYFQSVIRYVCDHLDRNALPDEKEIEENTLLNHLENDINYGFLNQLAYLEHMRWCAFCYSRGFVGYTKDPDKNKKDDRIFLDKHYQPIQDAVDDIHDERVRHVYYGKVHNCLIADWEEMMEDEEASGTIWYDVQSIYVYSIFSNK